MLPPTLVVSLKVGFDVNPVEKVVDEVPGGEEGDSEAKTKTSSKLCHKGDDGVNLERGTIKTDEDEVD